MEENGEQIEDINTNEETNIDEAKEGERIEERR